MLQHRFFSAFGEASRNGFFHYNCFRAMSRNGMAQVSVPLAMYLLLATIQDLGRSCHSPKYELTISHGDPIQAPGSFKTRIIPIRFVQTTALET